MPDSTVTPIVNACSTATAEEQQPLALALLDALKNFLPVHNEAVREAICSYCSEESASTSLHAAVTARIHNGSEESLVLRHRLAQWVTQLTEDIKTGQEEKLSAAYRKDYDVSLDQLYVPVLLALALDSKWLTHSDIAQGIKHWTEKNAFISPFLTSNVTIASCNAGAFLETLLSLKNTLYPEHRTFVFTHAIENLLEASQRWNLSMVPQQFACNMLLRMGRTAMECSTAAIDGVPIQTACARHTQDWLKYTDFYIQKAMTQALLDSELPEAYKWEVLDDCNPLLWCAFKDFFGQKLPTNEIDAFAQLPWFSLAQPFDNIREQTKKHRAHTNARLVECFCPTMFPLLDLIASQEDWFIKAKMQVWVNRLAEGSLDEVVDLPKDLVGPV